MTDNPLYFFFVAVPLLAVMISCGSGDKQSTSEPGPPFDAGIPAVPDIVAQFNSIDGHGGYPFTFRYWNSTINNGTGGFIGDDPTLFKHYQGVNRVLDRDGASYFYLSRNGNPIWLSGEIHDYPGEILIVKMGARNRTGETLSENYTGTPYGMTQPLPEDFTVKSVHLDGVDPLWNGEDVDWKHPGSGQQVGDLFFIPVEKRCSYSIADEHCTGDEGIRGAILVFNMNISDTLDTVISPANPQYVCELDIYYDPVAEDGYYLPFIGTLAVTEQGDNYLFAHTTGGSYNMETALTFYEIEKANLCQNFPGTSFPYINRTFIWSAGWIKNADGEPALGYGPWEVYPWEYNPWRHDPSGIEMDYQMLNFLYDTEGDLYLVGTDKSTSNSIPFYDYAKLFKVEREGNEFTILHLADKHLYLGEPVDIGSLKAGGGVYVSPSGKLILYSTGHDNDWPPFIFGIWPDIGVCNGDDRCQSLEMGEFTSIY